MEFQKADYKVAMLGDGGVGNTALVIKVGISNHIKLPCLLLN